MSKTNLSVGQRSFLDAVQVNNHQEQRGEWRGTSQVQSGVVRELGDTPVQSGSLQASLRSEGLASSRKTASLGGENAVNLDALDKLQREAQVLSRTRGAKDPGHSHKSLSRMIGRSAWREMQGAGTSLLDVMKSIPASASLGKAWQGQLQQAQEQLKTLESSRPSIPALTSAVKSVVATLQQGVSMVQENKAVEASKPPEVADKAQATGQKEKSIWEKIADFFKQAFSWLLKIFEFLSPLLNLIPGVGPAVFAAYQGIKLLAGIIQQDAKGVIGSVAGMVGNLFGPVGNVAGSVAAMVSKAAS